MSRKREVEVYMSEEVTLDGTGYWCNINQAGGYRIKAKLIIELPERKVTITESEFEACAWGLVSFSQLKRKLFGDER